MNRILNTGSISTDLMIALAAAACAYDNAKECMTVYIEDENTVLLGTTFINSCDSGKIKEAIRSRAKGFDVELMDNKIKVERKANNVPA